MALPRNRRLGAKFSEIFVKIRDFRQNPRFSPKSEIFAKIRDFRKKIEIFAEINEIFVKIQDFSPKSEKKIARKKIIWGQRPQKLFSSPSTQDGRGRMAEAEFL